MTDKEKIRAEIERLMTELIQEKEKGYGSDADDVCILELQNVLTFIDSLPEEPVNKNLEEVFGHMADTYYNDVLLDEHPMPEDIAHHCRLSYFLGLKAGANYQKQQDYIPVSKDLEEKAKQLGQKYFPDNENIWPRPKDEATRVEMACIEMAQWQEQQDEKDIDMLTEWLKNVWEDIGIHWLRG